MLESPLSYLRAGFFGTLCAHLSLTDDFFRFGLRSEHLKIVDRAVEAD